MFCSKPGGGWGALSKKDGWTPLADKSGLARQSLEFDEALEARRGTHSFAPCDGASMLMCFIRAEGTCLIKVCTRREARVVVSRPRGIRPASREDRRVVRLVPEYCTACPASAADMYVEAVKSFLVDSGRHVRGDWFAMYYILDHASLVHNAIQTKHTKKVK